LVWFYEGGESMTKKARKDIYQDVKLAVMQILDVSEDKVSIETSFSADLNADSLDIVEVLMKLEDKYGIEIPEEMARNLCTVKEMVDYIEQRLQEK